ncbi:oligosaccharide flippase family protein [Glaciecola sp. MF2-115]|uniref:oligosaccharide flippase family protein n=1 Tax=Glaciecola sp. MF2-115 TaxID=3384827 RepID=UPI00399F37E5
MSISQKVLKGSIWSLAISWFNRSIGLISTLILLRVLQPADFGIVALATMVMLLFMSFCELGIRQYIIKTPDITDEMVNNAWSLQLVINFIITICLLLTAPVISTILGDEKLTDILRVIAFIPSIAALNNIGGTLLIKQLDYSKVTKIAIGAKLVSTPVTIYIAVIHKSYWALVIGNLTSIIVVCIFSYLFISYRPRLRFSKFKEIFAETKWLLIGTLTGFIRSKIESFIVNSKFGVEGLGLYDTSKEFALLPLSDIITPASAPLLAGVSSIKTGLNDAYKAIIKYLYIAMFFIIPSIVGIFIVGDLFVEVVMGEQWIKAIPIFKTVSILMIVFPIYNCCRTIMFLSNDLKVLTIMDIASIAAMLAILTPSFIDSLEFLAWGRVLIGVCFAFTLIAMLKVRYKFSVKPIFVLFVAVLTLSLPFASCIYFLKLHMLDQGKVISLLVSSFCGCIVYLSTVFFSIKILAKRSEYFLFTSEFINNNISTIKTKVSHILNK